MPCERVVDIHSLDSDALTKLYDEANSLISGIRIEILPANRADSARDRHPAATVGLPPETPTIQFSVSLDRISRIEAIAHELAHLLLMYRYGLGIIGRKVPRGRCNEDVFHYFMSMPGDWVFLLGQIANTAHHLILIDHLRNEYGIESHLHYRVLQHDTRSIANDNNKDKESVYAKGVIAFEYERLIGQFERIIQPSSQTESFWTAYHAAQECFGRYSYQSIPTSFTYEANILSFLEILGYARENFIFFPEKVCDSRDSE